MSKEIVGPRFVVGQYSNGIVRGIHVIKTIIWHGRIAPNTAAFKLKGDGINTCYICGKDLPDPLSSARNIGPECIKIWGPWPGREFVEDHVKAFKAYQRKAKKEGQIVAKFDEWLKINS
jgi:hypothetical protein